MQNKHGGEGGERMTALRCPARGEAPVGRQRQPLHRAVQRQRAGARGADGRGRRSHQFLCTALHISLAVLQVSIQTQHGGMKSDCVKHPLRLRGDQRACGRYGALRHRDVPRRLQPRAVDKAISMPPVGFVWRNTNGLCRGRRVVFVRMAPPPVNLKFTGLNQNLGQL
jgi:hypothetical protein